MSELTNRQMDYEWIFPPKNSDLEAAKQKYLSERKQNKSSWFSSWLDYLHLRNKFNENT